MKIDIGLLISILVPIIAAVVAIIVSRIIERRPRLLAWYLHSGAITVQDEKPFRVHTHAVVLKNTGKLPATNVRLTHSTLPDFSVFPSVGYTVEILPDGTKEILIPQIVPNEQLTVSYLYYPPLLWNQVNYGIKYDGGFAKGIEVVPTRKLKKWQVLVALALWIVGFITVVYFATNLAQWLVSLLVDHKIF